MDIKWHADVQVFEKICAILNPYLKRAGGISIMILLSQIIKEVAKESLPNENMESAAKKLRRKFEKLIRVCGGDIEKMKDGKNAFHFQMKKKSLLK